MAPTTVSTKRSAIPSRFRSRPEYLKQIGLLDTVRRASADIGLLLNHALEKVAFLPFGLMIDQMALGRFLGQDHSVGIQQMRGGIFAWNIREWPRRSHAREADFDPGAKYHMPANVPYTRYFLSAFCSFSFIARFARRPDTLVR